MVYYEPERADPSGGIYYQWNENIRFGPHLHDSFEMLYVCEGAVELTVDGRPFTVSEGCAALVFPNQIHSAVTPTRAKTYVCIFGNSLVGEFYQSIKNSVAVDPVFALPDTALVEKLVTPHTPRYRLKSYLYELIYLFDSNNGAYTEHRNRPDEHIGQVLTFIAAHHTEPISMLDAAKAIGYDHHYLSNLLQKHLHTTFRGLLNEYRISHAKRLLTTASRPISCVAAACGYESLCSFNRNFKAIVGMTPSAYQRGKK